MAILIFGYTKQNNEGRKDMNDKVTARKKLWKKGDRIELISMDDIQAPPAGTKGTVIGVDDMGQIMVNWDNGSSLSVIPEAGDQIRRYS